MDPVMDPRLFTHILVKFCFNVLEMQQQTCISCSQDSLQSLSRAWLQVAVWVQVCPSVLSFLTDSFPKATSLPDRMQKCKRPSQSRHTHLKLLFMSHRSLPQSQIHGQTQPQVGRDADSSHEGGEGDYH